jgi:hypothetical protein
MDPRIARAMQSADSRAALARWFEGLSRGGGDAFDPYGRGFVTPPYDFANYGATNPIAEREQGLMDAALQTPEGRDVLAQWFVAMRQRQQAAQDYEMKRRGGRPGSRY